MAIMHNPPHPSELLNEAHFIPLGLSITDMAKRMGISRKHLSSIVNAKSSINADMAKRIGTNAQMWLNMQAQYDLWQLRDKKYNIEKVA